MWSRPRAVLNRCLEAAVTGLIAALALLVICGVASRKAGFSLVWYDEVAAILLAWLTYYGAALAALHRAHLGFPNLVNQAPRGLRLGLVILREVAIVLFFGLTAYLGMDLLSVFGRYVPGEPAVDAGRGCLLRHSSWCSALHHRGAHRGC